MLNLARYSEKMVGTAGPWVKGSAAWKAVLIVLVAVAE
jgi:hypothetical protein